jgi:hypothetical protein
MSKSKSVVLHHLADLAGYFPLDDLPPSSDTEPGASEPAIPPVARSTSPAEADESPLDLGALLAEIAQASATVASLTQQDREARQAAHSLLERYEALSAEATAAERAWNEAQRVRHAAECLAADAFAEMARTAAQALLPMALQAEAAAARLVEQRRMARDGRDPRAAAAGAAALAQRP